MAITPSGVWVIDPKRYQGEVSRRDVGGWFSTDVRLYVGRRDCTKLVEAMDKQVVAVRKALGTEWAEISVRPMLCFLTEWPLFSKPFELDGVLVTWPRAMRELLVRAGPYDPATVQLIAARLDDASARRPEAGTRWLLGRYLGRWRSGALGDCRQVPVPRRP